MEGSKPTALPNLDAGCAGLWNDVAEVTPPFEEAVTVVVGREVAGGAVRLEANQEEALAFSSGDSVDSSSSSCSPSPSPSASCPPVSV